jgi:hypothetical protein
MQSKSLVVSRELHCLLKRFSAQLCPGNRRLWVHAGARQITVNNATNDQHQPLEHPKQQEQQWSRVAVAHNKLSFRAILQQYGHGAFLSYITFSNLVSVGMLSSAVVLYTHRTGCMPLQQGHWPQFLIWYAAAYAIQHIARPLKVMIGLASAGIGTFVVNTVAHQLGSSKHVALITVLVFEAVVLLLVLCMAAACALSIAASRAASASGAV